MGRGRSLGGLSECARASCYGACDSFAELVANYLRNRSSYYDVIGIALEMRDWVKRVLEQHGIAMDDDDQFTLHDDVRMPKHVANSIITDVIDDVDLEAIAARHALTPEPSRWSALRLGCILIIAIIIALVVVVWRSLP